ncbi:unnamed protein product, partial [Protopolystoma xenopodis]
MLTLLLFASVTDLYQEWCGPCKAVTGLFKRLKNELNDELLNFAIAKGGTLVCVVRGANPPELERCIREKLTQEHEILSGELERIEIKDPYLVALEEAEAEEIRRKEEEE